MRIQYDNDTLQVIGYADGGYMPSWDFYIDLDTTFSRPHKDYQVNAGRDGIELRPQAVIDDENDEAAWVEVRAKRDEMLAESDWRDLPSYPGDDQVAWRTYRTDLREIPQDFARADDVVYPDKPE